MNLTHKFIMWDFGDPDGSSVQSGYRPAFVVKEHEDGMLLLAAVTSKEKPMPTHVYVRAEDADLPKDSVILLEQLFWVNEKPENELAIFGDLQGNEKFERLIKKKLKISLGIFLTKSHIEGLTPPISRGQVFDNNGKEVAVLQNDMGNFYSPTTIIGDIKEGAVSSIRTVPSEMLLSAALKGVREDVSEDIYRLIS